MKKWIPVLVLLLGPMAFACPDIRGAFQCEDIAGPFELYVQAADPESFAGAEIHTEDRSSAALYSYSIYRGYELGPNMPPDEYQILLNYYLGSVLWSSARPFVANNAGIYQSVVGTITYQYGSCHFNRVSRYLMTSWDRVYKTDWITLYSESFILSEGGDKLTFEREYQTGFKNLAACHRIY